MDPNRLNRNGVGLFELVIVGIIGFCVYALAIRGRHHDAPAAPPRDSEEPQPVPRPEPTPEPEAVAEPEPPEPEPTEPEPEAEPPPDPEIGREDITAAIAVVKKDINGCGRRHPADGTVKVRVQIAPSGRPTTVSVLETPDDGLGRCVAGALKKLKLPESSRGALFTYPFSFGEQ